MSDGLAEPAPTRGLKSPFDHDPAGPPGPGFPPVVSPPWRDAGVDPRLAKILSCPTPSVVSSASSRRASRQAVASRVRELLKGLGVEGVSVIAPCWPRARGVEVHLPGPAAHHHGHGDAPDGGCRRCVAYGLARDHLERLILAAFPDLGDGHRPPILGVH